MREQLANQVKDKLSKFLREIAMSSRGQQRQPGIPHWVINHSLDVDPKAKPVKQKKRKLSTKKLTRAREEVHKLLRVGYIKEVKYPEWLSKVVMVKKSNGKERMCVDFVNLNRACLKDYLPLPSIDRMVDVFARNQLLTFMNTFSRYNLIFIHHVDLERTSFITEHGTMYQRLVNKIFKEEIRKSMEVYVDEIQMKSHSAKAHVEDLARAFESFRRNKIKPNPTKCTFAVEVGQFLGFMIYRRGIKANLEKVRALQDMKASVKQKDIQKLIGRIVTLNRFVSKLAECCLTFFTALKTVNKFN